jgi:drug/metabolite transporter (DMT)-like permease
VAPVPAAAQDNLRGAAFMTAAMAGFAVEDALLKAAGAAGVPVGQILMIFGGGGMVAFALLARLRGDPIFHPAILSRPLLIRAVFEVAGRLFYTLAFTMAALSSASAILQAAPLVVVGGAALFLGERVGWRRWAAVLAGFAGVLVILRPGAEGFGPGAIFAVLGMIGFAGRDLATRAAPKVLSNFVLGAWGFAMMVPAGAVLLALTGGAVVPPPPAMAALAGAIGIGVGAYYALTVAMRTGDVGAVTPFRYTRLLFGIGLGIVLFGERPDLATWVGGTIVVAAGLAAWRLGRRVA